MPAIAIAVGIPYGRPGDSTPGGASDVMLWETGIGVLWEVGIFMKWE